MCKPLEARRPAALAVLYVLCASTAGAWGSTGHRTVGLIAERYLTRNVLWTTRELLDGQSLAQVSTWADNIRSDPNWKKASPWHYVNLDDHETYETAAKNPDGDVVTAMRKFEAVLRDRNAPRKARAEALKFLVHFVGDIHQPLHAGKRSDRGGNEVKLTWFGAPANLHEVWDSRIIDLEKVSYTELADFIDRIGTPKDSQVSAWQKATYLDWVKESFDLRSRAYEIGDGKLNYAYASRHLPLIHERLLQAGIRLAALLNSIFHE